VSDDKGALMLRERMSPVFRSMDDQITQARLSGLRLKQIECEVHTLQL
jgi:hypothetical protein